MKQHDYAFTTLTGAADVARALNHGCDCRSLDPERLRQHLEAEPALLGLAADIAHSRPHLFSATAVFMAPETLQAMADIVTAIEAVVALPAYLAEALGITADDDERTMVRAADEVRSTWLQLHEAGATLDRVFEARQQLSTVAGVAPNLAGAALTVNQRDALERGIGSTKVNWAVVVTRSGSARLAPRDPANAWVRWFDVTDELELRLPSELTPDDLIRAYHEGLAGALYAEAEHRAGTHTEED